MSIFKCKMCGGTIKFEPGAAVGVCDSCGTKQTLPQPDGDRRANDRANHVFPAREKAAKKRKRIIAVTASIVIALIAFAILLTKEIIPNSKYNNAVKLFEAGKYEEAIKAFEALDGYKDSEEQIGRCETAIQDLRYDHAGKLCEAGQYDDAIAEFKALDGYKDSDEKASECLFLKQKAGISNVSVSSTIKFGFYEQDNNTSNGKEEIEWTVLAVNGSKALIISKYALDRKSYNIIKTSTTWEECSLRTWLNETFYNAAFSAYHQKVIISSAVTADRNPSCSTPPGNDTTDKVFLLSIIEANKYFESDEARKCAPTDYAVAQGAYTNDSYIVDGRPACWWWLRSPGYYYFIAAGVGNDGAVDRNGDDVSSGQGTVRPALWIDLEP